MCNEEIICGEMLLRGISEECHTFARWKSMGYVVKKGEKALFQTTIWKCNDKKREEIENSEEGKSKIRMFMKKSSFFGFSQVEKIKDKKDK